jgi:hypothetical protein
MSHQLRNELLVNRFDDPQQIEAEKQHNGQEAERAGLAPPAQGIAGKQE